MSSGKTIGVGVIGLGFMGRTHVAAYRWADRAGHTNRLAAVCDQDPERRAGRGDPGGNIETEGAAERLFDPDQVAAYADPAELIADPGVQLVSICTPTDTHVDLALAALEAGKHVLVEKPVALRADDVERLAAAARDSDRVCMPAMCVRFWPAWRWLRDRIRDGSLGAVRSAVFQRLATMPAWGREFYADVERSGGALVDLHVHDTDFVRFCFGDPEWVASTGTPQHLTTLYRYPRGPAHVVAEGGWDHSPGFPFTMRYTVVFEAATADYALGRAPELRLARAGGVEPVALEPISGYEGEIRHVLAAIEGGAALDATIEDALAHARILEAERRSLETGEAIRTG